MNKINYTYIFLTLILFSCNSLDTILKNNRQEWNLDYKINLQRLDSGEYKNYATIKWNRCLDINFSYYNIVFNDETINIDESEITNYIINLEAGEIVQINFNIYNTSDDIISQDSIQVYTRVVYPVNNLNYSIDGTYKHFLSWDASIEIDFDYYKIYRSIDPSLPLSYINPTTCNINNNCIEIEKIEDQSIIEYTDSTTTGLGYSYIITTFDINGLYRNSTIETSFTELANELSNCIATENYNHKIIISWDSDPRPNDRIPEFNEFYSIDIWRGSSINVDDNVNHTKLATIYDSDINFFEDHNNIGSSTSWYYMIKITNIFGRYYKSSEDIEGMTQP